MNNLIALDTSAEHCSIALITGDSKFVYHERVPRLHSKLLLSEIDNLMSKAKLELKRLDGIVFTRGPGSFTGVRICTSVAQGLGMGLQIPLIPVSTLDVLAFEAFMKLGEGWKLPAIDARMNEVYWGPVKFNEQGQIIEKVQEQVIPPSQIEIIKEFNNAPGIGSGWQLIELPSFKPSVIESDGSIKSEIMLDFIKVQRITPVSAIDAQPVYLRDKVTWDNKPKIGSN